MRIPTYILGLAAMAGSPFLFAEYLYNAHAGAENTSMSGVFDLIYMTGWSCSIVGLYRMCATGDNKSGRIILYVQFSLLLLANIWNIWTIINPGDTSLAYRILDFSWPASNVCLLIIGIVVARTHEFKGWKRYSALAAGLWLPFAIITMIIVGKSELAVYVPAVYSTIAWFIMGLAIYLEGKKIEISVFIPHPGF
jgi:hypothetical protein